MFKIKFTSYYLVITRKLSRNYEKISLNRLSYWANLFIAVFVDFGRKYT